MADVEMGELDLQRALAHVELATVQKRLAQMSFMHFNEAVFGWKAFHADGTPVVPIHHDWNDHIEGCWGQRYYAGIQGPRDHGKTMQIAVARSIWEMGVGTDPTLEDHISWWRPNFRIKLFQNTDTNAKKTVILIRTIIDKSPTLQAIFPDLKRDPDQEWSQHRLCIMPAPGTALTSAFERDPNFEGAAIMSHATSGRADIIKADDICDMDNSILEPATRPKILQTWDAVIYHLREPWTQFVNIGTAWHDQDANACLQRRSVETGRGRWVWRIDRIQELPGAKMKVLWPGKWTIEALMESYENNAREFERGFNNRAITDEDTLVNWKFVKACFRPDLLPGEAPFPVVLTIVGYDLAIGKNEHSSYFAAFVLGCSADGRQMPLEIIRDRLPFRRQVETVLGIHERIRPTPSEHVVESNGYQMALVHQLAAEGQVLPVSAFQTGKNKADLYYGLPSLEPSFAAGEWVIGTKGGHDGETLPNCECPQCVWLRELHYFPTTTFDIVMASWFAHTRARSFRNVGAEPASVPSEMADAFPEATFTGADEDSFTGG
jgi:hypothetical protein